MNTKNLATGAVSLALALSMVSTSAFAAAVEFTDVSANHWARPYIMSMADKGIMSGVGGNKFAPSSTLTYAEFLTMITKQYYSDKLTGKGAYWYSPYMDAAKAADILSGVNAEPLAKINRYEMAQIMYNVLKKEGATTSPLPDTSKVGDWSAIPSEYQDAVSVCYNMGLLSGTDANGTFSGNTMLDRAQAAVVMDKLIKLCAPSNPTPTPKPEPKPEGGSILAGATQITKREQLTVEEGVVECEGGFHMDGSGLTYGRGSIAFTTAAKDTLTFELRAGDVDVLLKGTFIGKEQSIWEPAEVRELGVVPAGTSQCFTIDISSLQAIALLPGKASAHSSFAECWITNIYLY